MNPLFWFGVVLAITVEILWVWAVVRFQEITK